MWSTYLSLARMAKAAPQKKVTQVKQAGKTPFWQSKNFTAWLVFGLAFVLYLNIVGGGYNMDDELVTINHRLTAKGISAIPEIFTSPYYQDNQGYSYEYRPLVLATFAIEHQFFGDNAQVNHFFNVLLYALCCLLLYKVLLKLFKNYSPLLALAATLLFIVHPAHTEVVCSIKNRDEVLGLIFALLTLQVCLKGIDTGKRWWFLLVPVCFALALMGKITVISFVVIIPIALVLFTNASGRDIALLELLLLIPPYFLMDVNGGLNKILLLTGVLLMTVIFYAAMNVARSANWLRMVRQRIKDEMLGGRANSEQGDMEADEYSPKWLFKGIVPGRHIFKVVPAVLTVLLTVLYALLVATFYTNVALIPLGILIVMALLGGESLVWWATVMVGCCLTVCIGLNQFTTNPEMLTLYCRLMGFYLAYQLYYGKRNLFIPTAIIFVLFNISSIYFANDFESLLFPLLIFFNQRYIRYVALAVLFFWSKDLLPFKNTFDGFDFASNIGGMLMLLSVQFKRGMKVVPWAVVVGLVLWFHYHQMGHNQRIGMSATGYALQAVGDRVNPKIIATPQNRPLNFIEECVDLTTPRNIRIGTSLEILYHYLTKVVVPYPLSYYYGYKYITPQKMTDTLPLISLVLHVLLLLAALYFLKREPLISFGLLVYLASVLVFSNYVQPVPGMMGDRFLLIPSLGWALVLVVVIQKIMKIDIGTKTVSWRVLPKGAQYGFAAVVLLYGAMTFTRSLDWYSDLKLMRHDINVVPESVQANNVLGIHLVKTSLTTNDANMQMQLRNEALSHLKTANALYPNYFNFVYDIGRVYNLLNMPDSALAYFKQAMPLNEDYPDVPLSIASIYFVRQDYNSAIPYFVKVAKKHPDDFTIFDRLSFAYFKTSQFDLSIQANEESIQHFPNRPDPYINIATCYLNRTDGYAHGRDSAVVWLNRALVVSPGNQSIIGYLQKIK